DSTSSAFRRFPRGLDSKTSLRRRGASPQMQATHDPEPIRRRGRPLPPERTPAATFTRERGVCVSEWNFADVWEAVADCVPEEPALIHGERRVTWAEFNGRAEGLARTMLNELGLTHQDKVAQYLYNCPE